jgi:hypothetical protein
MAICRPREMALSLHQPSADRSSKASPTIHGPIGSSHRRTPTLQDRRGAGSACALHNRLALPPSSISLSRPIATVTPGPGTRTHDKSLRIFFSNAAGGNGVLVPWSPFGPRQPGPLGDPDWSLRLHPSIRQSSSARLLHQDNRRHYSTPIAGPPPSDRLTGQRRLLAQDRFSFAPVSRLLARTHLPLSTPGSAILPATGPWYKPPGPRSWPVSAKPHRSLLCRLDGWNGP